MDRFFFSIVQKSAKLPEITIKSLGIANYHIKGKVVGGANYIMMSLIDLDKVNFVIYSIMS